MAAMPGDPSLQVELKSMACFVCDDVLSEAGVELSCGLTACSRTELPTKISQVMGAGFVVVCSTEDKICTRCSGLLNQFDKLEADLAAVHQALTGYLNKKYNLLQIPVSQIHVGEEGVPEMNYEGGEGIEMTVVTELPDATAEEYVDASGVPVAAVAVAAGVACSMCDARCPNNKLLRAHIIAHHLTTWPCHFCGSSFSDEAEFTSHVSAHLRRDPAPAAASPPAASPPAEGEVVLDEAADNEAADDEATQYMELELEPADKDKLALIWEGLRADEDAGNQCLTCSLSFVDAAVLKRHLGTHGRPPAPVAPPQRNQRDKSADADLTGSEDEDLDSLIAKMRARDAGTWTGDQVVSVRGTNLNRLIRAKKLSAVPNPAVCEDLPAQRTQSRSKTKAPSGAGAGFHCDVCDLAFVRPRQLADHVAQTHRDPHCRFCGKEILKAKTLRAHEQRHLRDDRRSFDCTGCSRSFKTATGLRHHAAVHTGEYKYCCDFCGRGFMSRMMMEEHRVRHTKEERYVCDICGKKFSFQSTYWIHRKWHDTPMPYKCPFCGRLFKHSSLLAVHRRKHTGERPYKCPHCPLTFPVGGTLKRHLILHTGVYPFVCPACKRGFTTKHKYVQHLHKAHQVVIEPKPVKSEFRVAVREPAGAVPAGTEVLLDWTLADDSAFMLLDGEAGSIAETILQDPLIPSEADVEADVEADAEADDEAADSGQLVEIVLSDGPVAAAAANQEGSRLISDLWPTYSVG